MFVYRQQSEISIFTEEKEKNVDFYQELVLVLVSILV